MSNILQEKRGLSAAHENTEGSSWQMRVLDGGQETEWSKVIAKCAGHDFYHTYEYHALAELQGDGKSYLFVYECEPYVIALPLLLRPINCVSAQESLLTGLLDATSVYGYAGPVSSHELPAPEIIEAFHRSLKSALVQRGVISVFSRLHPLLPQENLLSGIGEIRLLGKTVSIDLTKDPAEQWKCYRENHKRGIRKLRDAGVVCYRDTEFRYLADFVEIYKQTMRRVGAENWYDFDYTYFERTLRLLGAGCHLFTAVLDGVLIGAGLFVQCGRTLQYHFGASRDGFTQLAPVKLVFDSVRVWAGAEGIDLLHLGGGVGSQEDSLFCFKAGFSDSRHSFSCWQWVVCPDVYQKLCNANHRFCERNSLTAAAAGYFPAYRSRLVDASK